MAIQPPINNSKVTQYGKFRTKQVTDLRCLCWICEAYTRDRVLQEAAAYEDAGSSRPRPSRMTAAEAGGHSRRGWGCRRQESTACTDAGSSRPLPARMTAAAAGIRSQRRMGMPRADAGCGPRGTPQRGADGGGGLSPAPAAPRVIQGGAQRTKAGGSRLTTAAAQRRAGAPCGIL